MTVNSPEEIFVLQDEPSMPCEEVDTLMDARKIQFFVDLVRNKRTQIYQFRKTNITRLFYSIGENKFM